MIRNGLFGWFGLGGSTVFVVALTPPLLKLLGTEQFGVWTFCMGVLGVAGFAEAGLGTATGKFISEDAASGDRDKIIETVVAALLVAVVCGLIATVAVCALAPLVALAMHSSASGRSVMVPVVETAALGIPAILIRSVCLAVPIGFQRYGIVAVFTFLQTVLIWTLAAVAATRRSGVLPVMLSSVTVLWCLALASGVVAARGANVRGGRRLLSWMAIRRVCRYSAFSGATGLGIQVFGSLDKVAVGIVLGASPLAYYSIAVGVTSKINQAMGAFWQPLMPASSALSARHDDSQLWRYYAYSTLACGVLCLIATLVLLAGSRALLDIWLGSSVSHEILRPLEVLIVVYAAFTVAAPAWHIANGIGSPGVCAASAIVGGVMTVGLIVPLGRIAGLEGVALANGGYTVALFVVGYLFLKLRPRDGLTRSN